MATRHFYEKDTVAAQLMWSLFNGEPQTALAAANELLLSDEADYLFEFLALAWWLLPPAADQRQRLRAAAFATHDPVQLLQTLLPALGEKTPLPPPTPIPALPPPTEGSVTPSATWTVWPAGWSARQAGKFWRALTDALAHGNWRRATFLTLPIYTQTAAVSSLLAALGAAKPLWEAFDGVLFQPLAARVLEHVFAVLAAPRVCEAVPSFTMPSAGGRTFRISLAALRCWGVAAPDIARLRGPPTQIGAADATAYWRNAVASVRGFNLQKLMLFEDWASAEDIETFYAAHFPQDIPEEWTRDEKEKSHFVPMAVLEIVAVEENYWRLAFSL
jgi:hypothetical protein